MGERCHLVMPLLGLALTLVACNQPARPCPRGPEPAVRMGATSASGRLPPEVIQGIVRPNFPRFRVCYENGLRHNPNLQGRVAVRFVIDRDGALTSLSDGGSDLPDDGVVSCMVRAFEGLRFPEPEGLIVTVVYQIMLCPPAPASAPAAPPPAQTTPPAEPTPDAAPPVGECQ